MTDPAARRVTNLAIGYIDSLAIPTGYDAL